MFLSVSVLESVLITAVLTEGVRGNVMFNSVQLNWKIFSVFPQQTSVLDSTALKNRVQLSRKSQRRAPSQLQRRSRLLQSSSQLAVIEDTDNLWMYSDTTGIDFFIKYYLKIRLSAL